MRITARLFFLFIIFNSSLKAQLINNLVIFCNDAEKFTVILDGMKMNAEPQTNVRMENLDLKQYKAKIIFQNSHLKDVNTTITFNDNGYECIFSLDKINHKKYQLNYLSAKAMPGMHSNDNNQGSNTTNSVSNNQVQQTDTVKPPPPQPPSGNPMDNDINQNINLGKNGMIKINENGTMKVGVPGTGMNVTIKKHPKKDCPNPVTDEEFKAFKENMEKLTTEADKEQVGNAFIENNCLLSSQVKEALTLFKTERVQLDFAKHAYTFTKDYERFSITVDGIGSQAGKDELRKFIEEHK